MVTMACMGKKGLGWYEGLAWYGGLAWHAAHTWSTWLAGMHCMEELA